MRGWAKQKRQMSTKMIPRSWSSDTSFLQLKHCDLNLQGQCIIYWLTRLGYKNIQTLLKVPFVIVICLFLKLRCQMCWWLFIHVCTEAKKRCFKITCQSWNIEGVILEAGKVGIEDTLCKKSCKRVVKTIGLHQDSHLLGSMHCTLPLLDEKVTFDAWNV